MLQPLLRDTDIAPDAAIRTDKFTDLGQQNRFLSVLLYAILVGGGDASDLHYHLDGSGPEPMVYDSVLGCFLKTVV